MNQLLFERSAGLSSPQAFARRQTAQLIRAIQPCPRLQFDGGEREVVVAGEAEGSSAGLIDSKIWAHQAGTSALALDVENRM